MRSRLKSGVAIVATLALAGSCATEPSGEHAFTVESPTTEPATTVAPTTSTTLPLILDPPGVGVSFPSSPKGERDSMPTSLHQLWTRSYTTEQAGTAVDEQQAFLVAQDLVSSGVTKSGVTVICLDRASGDEQWATTLPGSAADWTFTNRALILVVEKGAEPTLVALSRATGKKEWSIPSGGKVLNSSFGDEDVILTVQDESRRTTVRAISLADGREMWRTSLSEFASDASYFEPTAGGLLFDWKDSAKKDHKAMVSTENGEMLWDVAYPTDLWTSIRVDEFFYFTNTDGYYDYITDMQVFDVATGTFGNRIQADRISPYFGDFVVGYTASATVFYDRATLTPIREFEGKHVDENTFNLIGDFIVERTDNAVAFYDPATLAPLGALPLSANAWTLWKDILISGESDQLRATRIADGKSLWSIDSPVEIDSLWVMNDLVLVEGEGAIWAMQRVANGLDPVWHLDDVSGQSWPLDDYLVLHMGDADLEYVFVDAATGEVMARLADLWSEGPYREYANGVMVDYWNNRTEFYLLPSWELAWTLDPGNWFHMDDVGTVQVEDDGVFTLTAYN